MIWPEFARLFQQITVTIESGFKMFIFGSQFAQLAEIWFWNEILIFLSRLVSIISGNEAEVLSVDLS